jgi:arsenate reductase (glutaredoxin)
MSLILYGIPNCDTVKKARVWLEAAGRPYSFHDYKKSGVDADQLAHWCDVLGWETVLNRAGTIFRKLSDAEKVGIDRDRAIALMIAQPSLIKRPIAAYPGGLLAGFKPDVWQKIFA